MVQSNLEKNYEVAIILMLLRISSVTWPFIKCGLKYICFIILLFLFITLKWKILEIDGSNQAWTNVVKSLIQSNSNIEILLSVTWPFQKFELQDFRFDIH